MCSVHHPWELQSGPHFKLQSSTVLSTFLTTVTKWLAESNLWGCISCFYVAVIKGRPIIVNYRRKSLFRFMVPEEAFKWRKGTEARGQSRKLRHDIYDSNYKTERMNWTWGEATNSQHPPPARSHLHNIPQTAPPTETKWGSFLIWATTGKWNLLWLTVQRNTALWWKRYGSRGGKCLVTLHLQSGSREREISRYQKQIVLRKRVWLKFGTLFIFIPFWI